MSSAVVDSSGARASSSGAPGEWAVVVLDDIPRISHVVVEASANVVDVLVCRRDTQAGTPVTVNPDATKRFGSETMHAAHNSQSTVDALKNVHRP